LDFAVGTLPLRPGGIGGIFPNLRCKDWDLSLFLLAQVHVREPQGDVPKRNPTTPSGFKRVPLKKDGQGRFGKMYFFLGPKWMVYRYC